jgi:hypothetical protein
MMPDPMISPLPLPPGEGRGEGDLAVARDSLSHTNRHHSEGGKRHSRPESIRLTLTTLATHVLA